MNLKPALLGIPLLFSDCDVQAGDFPKRPHYTVPAGDRLVDPRLADDLVSPETKTPEEKERARVAREVARCVFLNGERYESEVESARWIFEDGKFNYYFWALNAKADVFNFRKPGEVEYIVPQYDMLSVIISNELPGKVDSDESLFVTPASPDGYEVLNGIRDLQDHWDKAMQKALERCKDKIS